MSLKIFNFKKYLLIFGKFLLLAAILGFFLRVALWEKHYYTTKEGSQRMTPTVNNSATEVDETMPTSTELEEYTVAPDRPRYLSIEKLSIKNARIIEIGLDKSKQLGTPLNIFDAGWYRASSKPGQGGTILIDGHNGGPTRSGIFKRLPELANSDLITIERGDGTIFKYKVVENLTVPLGDADKHMAKMEQSPVPGTESLSLITCTGTWSQAQRTYLSRQFIRAILAE